MTQIEPVFNGNLWSQLKILTQIEKKQRTVGNFSLFIFLCLSWLAIRFRILLRRAANPSHESCRRVPE